MPKEGSHCICLSVTLIDYIFKIGRNFYQKVFLEECKCIVKEKKDLDISPNYSDGEISAKESMDV